MASVSRLPSVRRPNGASKGRPASMIEESNVRSSGQATAIPEADVLRKAKRRSLLPQFNRKVSAEDKAELGIQEEEEEETSRSPFFDTQRSDEVAVRRGMDEDRRTMPPPAVSRTAQSRLSRPTSMIPPRGASQFARTSSYQAAEVQRPEDQDDAGLEAARAQSLAALTGAAEPPSSRSSTSTSGLQRTGSTRLPQSPRVGGPAIPSRTTSTRSGYSRTNVSSASTTSSTSIAEKRSSVARPRPTSHADAEADSAIRTSPPRSSMMARGRPTSHMPEQPKSPAKATVSTRARPTSQMLPPPKPAFTTFQQHYSPAKSALPKPPLPVGKPSKPVVGADDQGDVTSDLAKQQIELLQLSIIHQASSKCMSEYTASAKKKLGKRHARLRKEYESIRAAELLQQRLRNLAALDEWCEQPSEFVEYLQILSLVYSDLTAFMEQGSRHADLVASFEAWVAEAEDTSTSTFIQPLSDEWKSTHSSMSMKLRTIQRNLNVLKPPRDAADKASSLILILTACRDLVEGMMRELEVMLKLEKELIARDRVLLEEDVKALVLEDNDGTAISHRLSDMQSAEGKQHAPSIALLTSSLIVGILQLKCTEERPACAQCLKAHRECMPASGIAFRHQQNPSMNGWDLGEGSLKNFYGYRETFDRRKTTWVEVPKDLTFVNTTNPYEDDEGSVLARNGNTNSLVSIGAGTSKDESIPADEFETARQLSHAAYPIYASQGLEASSLVASRVGYAYAPPPAPMAQQGLSNQDGMLDNAQSSTSQNFDFIMNPVSTSGIEIDPQLDAGMARPLSRGLNRDQVSHKFIAKHDTSHGRASSR